MSNLAGFSYFYVNQNSKSMSNIQEIWRTIEGFERYSVSTEGRVFDTKKYKIIKPCKLSNGYLGMAMNGKCRYVHRLVAVAFLDASGKALVNHIDRDTKNNRLSNLIWVTPKENLEHSKNLIGDWMADNKWQLPVEVHQISYDGFLIASYPSMAKAAKAMGIPHHRISKAVNRGHATAGYYWFR